MQRGTTAGITEVIEVEEVETIDQSWSIGEKVVVAIAVGIIFLIGFTLGIAAGM